MESSPVAAVRGEERTGDNTWTLSCFTGNVLRMCTLILLFLSTWPTEGLAEDLGLISRYDRELLPETSLKLTYLEHSTCMITDSCKLHISDTQSSLGATSLLILDRLNEVLVLPQCIYSMPPADLGTHVSHRTRLTQTQLCQGKLKVFFSNTMFLHTTPCSEASF